MATKTVKTAAIKPLTRYGVYQIHRRDNIIAFGCGAVKVKKSDLLDLANIIREKRVTRDDMLVLQHVIGEKIYFSGGSFGEFKELFKAINSLVEDKKKQRDINLVRRVHKATNGRKSILEILNMSPTTLVRIVGSNEVPVKPKTKSNAKRKTQKSSSVPKKG